MLMMYQWSLKTRDAYTKQFGMPAEQNNLQLFILKINL